MLETLFFPLRRELSGGRRIPEARHCFFSVPVDAGQKRVMTMDNDIAAPKTPPMTTLLVAPDETIRGRREKTSRSISQ